MKKIFTLVLSGVLLFTLGITALASGKKEGKEFRDMAELKPYQRVIDKLNKELNSNMCIPSDEIITKSGFDKNEIYHDITKKSLKVFEDDLREAYTTMKSGNDSLNTNDSEESDISGNHIEIQIGNIESKTVPSNDGKDVYLLNSIQPFAVSEQITQYKKVPYGELLLSSYVYSATGKIGTFYYSSIIGPGYKASGGTNYRPWGADYTLASDRKSCTVKYLGANYKDGVQVSEPIVYSLTYHAN